LNNKKEKIGWYFYDWAISAFSTTVITVFLGPYLTEIAKAAADENGYIYIMNLPVYAASFFTYAVSLSVILQVLILPYIGAVADHTAGKKNMWAAFSYIGAFATIGMFFLQGNRYMLGGILLVVSNLSFGAAMVLYNAYLNDIADENERDDVSSKGWAFGYLGGGLLLLLNLMFYSNAESFGIEAGMAVRICLASAGVWWAGFTIIPLLTLKKRVPNSTIPAGQNYFSFGIKKLFSTIKDARKLPYTLWFLLAYLFYNDGVQAVIVVSAQFGQEELGLDISTLTSVILMVQFVAFFGAILFNKLSMLSNTKIALLVSLVIWVGLVFYAYKYLENELQFYILGAVIGLVLGGTQALSRSLYSLMIPKGKESEYYSLYEISERGTSWMGPLVFGLSLQFTGSYRVAIFSLGVFFVIGFAGLLALNVRKGITLAGNKIPAKWKW
jgi:UMF1 family MFS transporter